MSEKSKELFEINKKSVISELMLKAKTITDELNNDPDFLDAMKDRQEHIERGELWVITKALKYAQSLALLAQIEGQIATIKQARFEDIENISKTRSDDV
jgi:hypothetical protein